MALTVLRIISGPYTAVRLWLCFAFCLTTSLSATAQADKEWQTYKSNSHAIADTHCVGNAPVKYQPLFSVQPASTIKFWRSKEDNSTALEVTYRAWAVNGDQPGIYALLGKFKMEVRYVDPDKGTTEIIVDGADLVALNVKEGQTETTGSVFINLPYLDDRHLIFSREGTDRVLESPHVRVVELSCED